MNTRFWCWCSTYRWNGFYFWISEWPQPDPFLLRHFSNRKSRTCYLAIFFLLFSRMSSLLFQCLCAAICIISGATICRPAPLLGPIAIISSYRMMWIRLCISTSVQPSSYDNGSQQPLDRNEPLYNRRTHRDGRAEEKNCCDAGSRTSQIRHRTHSCVLWIWGRWEEGRVGKHNDAMTKEKLRIWDSLRPMVNSINDNVHFSTIRLILIAYSFRAIRFTIRSIGIRGSKCPGIFCARKQNNQGNMIILLICCWPHSTFSGRESRNALAFYTSNVE